MILDFAPTTDAMAKTEADFLPDSCSAARRTSSANASTAGREDGEKMREIGRGGLGGAKSRIKLRVLCAFFATWLLASSAFADVQRFAVIIGNDRGHSDDTPLRYAETDAAKVGAVLRDLGGFEPANMVVLRDESASAVRRSLITVNDRVRAAQSLPGTETLLFVYYSGHSDAQALRLGASRLEHRELTELVRGSAATFRVLVVDACRSGQLTRVKGGRPVAAFDITRSAGLGGQGMAFLTASSANEDAQESDELKGSFFTHALVSALLGAGDADQDGAVVLEEAYRHAHDATLRATSRTFAGVQHPTFQFEMRGQESLVLTRPGARGDRARLTFPTGMSFLVMAKGPEGAVVGEVGLADAARTLSVKPGQYFVRGRGADVLFEGTVTLGAGATQKIDTTALERVAYARLVRKGARTSAFSHGPELGGALRTSLPNADGVCWGALVGYRLELESLSLLGRLGLCTSTFENGALEARTNEASFSLGVVRAWDFSWLSAGASVGAGASLWSQSFETQGRAPDRLSTSPFAYLGARFVRELSLRTLIAIEIQAEGHLLDIQQRSTEDSKLRVEFAARSFALLGAQF